MSEKDRVIKVGFVEGADSECAEISISRIGSLSDLEFGEYKLNGIAQLQSLDMRRIFDALKEAEMLRVEPNQETIRALDHLRKVINYVSDDESHLDVEMRLELPIACTGAVTFEPKEDTSIFDCEDL